MPKKSTRARHHRHHVKVLKSEVMSPRIAWFNFLDALKRLSKLALLITVLGVAGYGIRKAIEHTFHNNSDFRLQVINLNPNDVLNTAGLVEHLEIDLAANIFDFDVTHMRQQLLQIPGVKDAAVERELPGTLSFKITTRSPSTWVAVKKNHATQSTRKIHGLLVDQHGFIYPCPENQFPQAKNLPVIFLSSHPDHPLQAGANLKHPEYHRCSSLLSSFSSVFPEDISMIEAIYQTNTWSICLETRSGATATFGLDEHERQLDSFSKALQHARKKTYDIETINLIPKQNIPITVKEPQDPPRAIPVHEEDLIR